MADENKGQGDQPETESMDKESKSGLCILGAIVFLLLGNIIFIIIVLSMAGYYRGALSGSGWLGKSGDQNTVDCSGYAKLTSEQYGWVKEAAGRYLGGDEASLIALIQIESGWNPGAKNPGSSAAGLGQFVTGTARGYPEFVGGNDKNGTVWSGGTVYDDPASHSDDARFDAKRSIFAAGHKFGGDVSRFGGVGAGYEFGYHTHGNGSPEVVAAAQAGRARLEEVYNNLTANGGCLVTSTSSTPSGEACGVIPVDQTNTMMFSVDSRLMPPAANDYNKMAADYRQRTGQRLALSDMFRSRADQIRICNPAPDGHCQNPNANRPGNSLHEAGLAFDVSQNNMTREDYNTLVSISSKYNWKVSRTTGYGTYESWHFDYTGTQYSYANVGAAIDAANSSCST